MSDEHNPYTAPSASLVDSVQETALAERGERLGAALIDGVIAFAIMGPVMYLGGYWTMAFEAGMRGEQVPIMTQAMWAAIGFIVFVLVQAYPLHKTAQTWGKRLLGIRIVDLQGGQPTLINLLAARYLPVHIVSQLPFLNVVLGLANVLLIFRADRRCGHDHIAKTRVVKAR